MRLLFVRSKSPFSFFVRLVEGLRSGRFTLAPWSHVAVVAADGLHIVDSMWQHGGVTRRTLDSFLGAFPDNQVVDVKLTNEPAASFWLDTQVGKPYDYRGLFGFIVGRSTEDPSAWYCFELAAAALRQGGLPISTDRCDCLKLLAATLPGGAQ